MMNLQDILMQRAMGPKMAPEASPLAGMGMGQEAPPEDPSLMAEKAAAMARMPKTDMGGMAQLLGGMKPGGMPMAPNVGAPMAPPPPGGDMAGMIAGMKPQGPPPQNPMAGPAAMAMMQRSGAMMGQGQPAQKYTGGFGVLPQPAQPNPRPPGPLGKPQGR